MNPTQIPQTSLPHQSSLAQNPIPPQTNSGPSSKKTLVIVLVFLLLLVCSLSLYLIISGKISIPGITSSSKQSPTILDLEKLPFAQQTQVLGQYFKNGNFNPIINYLAIQTPNGEWINSVKDINLIYLPMSSQSARIASASTPIAYSSQGANLSKVTIRLSSYIETQQPYAASAYLIFYLRSAYNLLNNTGLSCLDGLVDESNWSSEYWNSLLPQQRAHISGYDDTELNRQNSKFAAYQQSQLKEWILKNVGNPCSATESAQPK